MRKSNYLWLLLVAVLLLPAQEMAAKKKKEKEVTDRELWAGVLYQMAAPVLSNMSEGKLQKNMQVEIAFLLDDFVIEGAGAVQVRMSGILFFYRQAGQRY